MDDVIVVGTDGSDTARRAVSEGLRLAKLLDAEVHLVSAYEPVRGTRIAGAAVAAAEIWQPLPDSEVNAVLAEAAGAARAQGLQVHTHARRGDPAEAVLDVAEDTNASMIVVGNKGMSSARRFVLGSVPNKISHHAPCNVLIVSTGDGAGRAAG